MQYASFTGVLRTILIILLIYYGVKFLSRLFAPYLMKYLSKEVEKKYGQQFGGSQYQQESQNREGEVSIDKMPNKQPTSNKKVGEYVDFEEID